MMNEQKINQDAMRPKESNGSREILEKNKKILVEKARQLGIAVDGDLRVSMEGSGLPQEIIKRDLREAERMENAKYHGLSGKERAEKKVAEEYEAKFGDLSVLIFNKYLSDKFLTIKTSRYDQARNEANIILLDARTGSFVCAICGVGSLEDSENKQKMIKIFQKNHTTDKNGDSGGRLDYGLIKEAGGNFVIGERKNLPILFLGEEKSRIDSGLQGLTPMEQESRKEKELFARFLSCLAS